MYLCRCQRVGRIWVPGLALSLCDYGGSEIDKVRLEGLVYLS